MATRRAEWLASIKPILDKDEAKKDAAALAKELGDILEVKVDASPENLDDLTKEFNAHLKTMGKQPIVFSEKTLSGIVSQFANAIAGGITNGVELGLQDSLKRLQAERESLFKQQKDLESRKQKLKGISNFAYDLSSAKENEAHAFNLDEIDVMKKAASDMGKSFDDFVLEMKSNVEVLQLQLSKLKMGTPEFDAAIKDFYEQTYDLFRMSRTFSKHPDLVTDKDLLEEFQFDNLQFMFAEDIDSYVDAFDQAIKRVYKTLSEFDTQLKEIDVKLKNLQGNDAEIIDTKKAKNGLKTLNEIEEAYKRIRVAQGERVDDRQARHILSAIEFDPTKSSEGIKTLYQQYQQAKESGDWVEEYRALLKYVKLYESYLKTDNKAHSNKITKRGNIFTPLYQQLKPMADNAQNMLQNILNMGEGKPLVGMGGAKKDSVEASPTSEDVANAQKIRVEAEAKAKADKEIAEAEAKARIEAEAKAKAEAEALKLAKQKRKEEEKAAAAAEEKRQAESVSEDDDMSKWMDLSRFKGATDSAKEKEIANEASAQATKEELDALKQTTTELEKQQKLLLYRRVDGEFDPNRISGRSIDALYDKNNNPIIQQALEYGFGGFGDGLYGSISEAAENLALNLGKDKVSFIEFDASDYKFYVNQTMEQAESLREFLLSLQKLVGAGTILDASQLTDIKDLSEDQLFEKARQIFENFSMSKEQFHVWLEDAKIESKTIADLFTKGEVPSDRHNFGTRFMKTLGYDGVLNDTGDDEYDGNYQGSVIYDPDVDKIKSSLVVFKSVEEYLEHLRVSAVSTGQAIDDVTRIQESTSSTEKQLSLADKYDQASESVKQLTNKLVTLDQQMKTLDERTAATQMDGFDKWNPTDEHKDVIVKTLNEYQRIMKEIADFPIVQTDDDKKKLIELKEEALKLSNTLKMAYRSDSNPDSYIKEYGISREQARAFMDVNDVSAQLRNEIRATLNEEFSSAFQNILGADGGFARALLDEADSLDELANKIVPQTNIEEELSTTIALLDKEKLTYEDILALVREYNDESRMRELAKAGSWDEYDKIFAHHTDIARKLVPINMMGMGSDSPDKWLATVGMSAETAAQRLKELYDRLHQVASVDDELDIGLDEDDDVRRENGALEDKLELLRDIAEQYGNDITQKRRDRFEELNQKDMNSGLTPKEDERYWELGEQIEEADQALEEFGETYDRIIVKLANGKKVEILPDDKGLRTLAKIDDEYGESYNGVEIEDVIFERVKQEAAETKQTVDGLNDSLEETKHLVQDDSANTGAGDASFAELQNVQAENETLRAENDALQDRLQKQADEAADDALRNQEARAELYEQISNAEAEAEAAKSRALAAEAEIDKIRKDSEGKKLVDKNAPDSEDELISLRTQLEDEHKMRVATENALSDVMSEKWNAEKRAEEAEARAAQAEKNLLGSLDSDKKQGLVNTEELKTLLNSIVYNVKIAHDDADKTANKIVLDDSTLEATLTKVFANILNPQAQQNDSEQKQVPWALESTLQAVKGVLDGIQTNTIKIGTIKPSDVDTIAGTALESKLAEIKSVLESIDNKIAKGGMIATRGAVKQANTQPVESEAKAQAARSNMMKSLINDYKTMGKLAAQFADDGNLETKAMLDNLKEEIARKRQSLKLTMDENASLREKYSIAFDAEKRLLDAEKAQSEIDKQKKKDDKEAEAAWKKQVKDAQRATGINAATSAANAGDQTVVRAIGTEGISKDIENKAKELSDQIKILRELRDDIDKKGDQASDEDRDDLSKQIAKVKELKTEVDGYLKIHEKYSGDNVTDLGDASNFGMVGSNQYWNNITAAIQKASGGRATIKGMNADTGELAGTTKIAANTFATWTATVDPLTGRLSMLRTGIKKTETIIEQITRKTKEIFTYFSGSSIIFKAINELKRGIQYVREIDLALTELKKVTDETEEAYDEFLKTAAKTGARLGSTISAVTEATATFAKLGYSMQQATEMAEAAIVYKNVGDNIASTEDAADSIISTMKGFGLEASESMAIVDKFNEVGNRFAITSQGIGEALRLSASALHEGGNSLDESIAIITAANEVVNDPSSVGTALKTLTLRLRGSKTELEEMGEDVSDMTTTTSQLQAKLLALTGGKVDIMLNETTFKNSTQILREMAEAWEDMNDIQRASALELMGGKRQATICPNVQKCA